MALKTVVRSLDEVEEQFRGLYSATSEGFVLQMDGLPPGAVPKSKLDEFRDNNIQLKRQLDELKELAQKFEGVDLDKIQKDQEELQKIRDKKLLDEGKVDELLAQRTEQMRKDLTNQNESMKRALEQTQAENQSLKTRLGEVMVESHISSAVTGKAVVRKGAMADVLSRARQTWRLNDEGKLVAMDGTDIKYGKDGKAPLTPAEWAESLISEAPYLFEGNAGGGGGGSGSGSGGANGQRRIDRGDKEAVSSNIDKIAKGEVVLTS